MWNRATARTNAQHGIGPAAGAFIPVVPVHTLIETINSDPSALSHLAARRGELSEQQRTAALKAFRAPRDAPRKAAPKVARDIVTAPGAPLGLGWSLPPAARLI